jgi:hypothetical protein
VLRYRIHTPAQSVCHTRKPCLQIILKENSIKPFQIALCNFNMGGGYLFAHRVATKEASKFII